MAIFYEVFLFLKIYEILYGLYSQDYSNCKIHIENEVFHLSGFCAEKHILCCSTIEQNCFYPMNLYFLKADNKEEQICQILYTQTPMDSGIFPVVHIFRQRREAGSALHRIFLP